MTTPAFPVAPRSELREAFVWIALGALIVIGSWRMDRFTQQGAEIYTAPGFWPASQSAARRPPRARHSRLCERCVSSSRSPAPKR